MYLTLGLIILPLAANAVNIVLSNDDGWADANIRVLYRTLKGSGHGVLLSAPAIDQSGTGSSMSPPASLKHQCQYHTCPYGSPATGMWQTDPNITYVNSFPASAMDYGINISGPERFGGRRPDLAISGINNGSMSTLTSDFFMLGANRYRQLRHRRFLLRHCRCRNPRLNPRYPIHRLLRPNQPPPRLESHRTSPLPPLLRPSHKPHKYPYYFRSTLPAPSDISERQFSRRRLWTL